MYEFYPLLILGAIIGAFSLIFILAYALMKNKKEAIGFDRNIKDSEIIKRLLAYAKPHVKSFLLVGLIMLVSISYDIISPLLIGTTDKNSSIIFLDCSTIFWYIFLPLINQGLPN